MMDDRPCSEIVVVVHTVVSSRFSLSKDRLAIFMAGLYNTCICFGQLSDVALGGATVFTELGLSVFPIKHAALFWMNLHPTGEGDVTTLHAGCPVLRGSKWGKILSP